MSARILTLDGKPLKDFSNPDRKVRWFKDDVYGDPVIGSLRTIAHLDSTSLKAVRRFGVELEVLQGAYNTDVEQSAGTHDKDAAIDCFIPNVAWKVAQKFLRACGWAAWWRYPPSFGNHIHMISLGYTLPVGIYVPGQVADYKAKPPRNGLAGHAVDPTWHPDDIDATEFDFREWEKEMTMLDKDDKDYIHKQIEASEKDVREAVNAIVTRVVTDAVDDIADAVLAAIVARGKSDDPFTVKDALKTLDTAATPTP